MTRRQPAHTAQDLARAFFEVTEWEREPEPDDSDAEPWQHPRANDPAYQRWLADNHLRDLSPSEVEARNQRVAERERAAAAARRDDPHAELARTAAAMGIR